MNEMVDRVAKAIAEKQHKSWIYDQAALSLADPVKVADTRKHLREAAIAAIEAMREPTQAMLDAAFELSDPGGDISVSDLDDVFSDMIDAALK